MVGSPDLPKYTCVNLSDPSEVFVELSQSPGVPRSSKPASLGNQLEKPDHQSDPLFDLTFVLTFDLSHVRHPTHRCGTWRPSHPPQSVPGSWESFYSHGAVGQEGDGISANPPRGTIPWELQDFVLTQHAPLPACALSKD